MQDLIRTLLGKLGEDPDREGLRDTPRRVEASFRFLTSGYEAAVEKVANGLRELGVQRGDRVGIFLPKCSSAPGGTRRDHAPSGAALGPR